MIPFSRSLSSDVFGNYYGYWYYGLNKTLFLIISNANIQVFGYILEILMYVFIWC